jgi:hypothetical protein
VVFIRATFGPIGPAKQYNAKLEGGGMHSARVLLTRTPWIASLYRANGGARRRVLISLCLVSVCGAMGVFSSAADAAAQPFSTIGALSSAAIAQPFGAFGASSSDAQASPDPSIVGEWDVSSSCSGSPCGTVVTISIGGQEAIDPACSEGEYCVTNPCGCGGNNFYGENVSLTPNGAGSWKLTCTGCLAGYYNIVSVQFDGDSFTGTATSYANGSSTGTVPYDGTCENCASADESVSGTVSNEVCGDGGCTHPGDGGVKVLVTGTDSDGNAVSTAAVSAADGSWSVMVPAGSYTAGPSKDGTTFGPPGFTPSSQAVTVSTQDVTGVDFVAPSYKISGELTNNNCGCAGGPSSAPDVKADCGCGSGPSPAADVKVDVTGDGGGVTTSATSDSAKDVNWSVEVPDGDYTVTPDDASYSWNPGSQNVTVDGTDEDDIDFDTCGTGDQTSDSTDILSSGAPTAHAAAAARTCTKTTVKCLSSTEPTPAACVVTVTDMAAKNPSPPTGQVQAAVNSLGPVLISVRQAKASVAYVPVTPYNADAGPCTLVAGSVGSGRSTCTIDFDAPGVLLPHQLSFRVAATYDGDAAHKGSISKASGFKLSPEPNFWSTDRGQKILTQSVAVEGLGGTGDGIILGAGTASGTTGSGAAFVTANAGWFVIVGGGLAGGAALDGIYAAFTDPFDPHYKVVAKPKPMRAPTVTVANRHGQRMLNSFLNNIEMQYAVTTVLGITEDRATSAHKVGDKHAYHLQEHAISRYLAEMAHLTEAELASQMAIKRALKRMLSAAHLGATISLPQISRASYAHEVATDPLTLEQAKLLLSFGIPNSYVANLETAEENARIPTKINVLTDIVNPTMIRDERKVAAMFRVEARKVPL